MLIVYAVWIVMVWMIFTYGRLVYRLLGESVEVEYARAWMIGLGLDNAFQYRVILLDCIKARTARQPLPSCVCHIWLHRGRQAQQLDSRGLTS